MTRVNCLPPGPLPRRSKAEQGMCRLPGDRERMSGKQLQLSHCCPLQLQPLLALNGTRSEASKKRGAMAVGSVITPEKYQRGRKRSSKDWYPPDMALVRSMLHARKMIMNRNHQRPGHGDVTTPARKVKATYCTARQ
ncbi:hypothetical protein EYF80_005792 [Liparis tanakae]|uniref:Uncharacterized protein n=1 Tax=Liparis tanakae TaxID=230148 RepID=A0A4Z2J1U7_9TELE|nr:hypothetical protein EYF80_005792 [Liparis tanakae]